MYGLAGLGKAVLPFPSLLSVATPRRSPALPLWVQGARKISFKQFMQAIDLLAQEAGLPGGWQALGRELRAQALGGRHMPERVVCIRAVGGGRELWPRCAASPCAWAWYVHGMQQRAGAQTGAAAPGKFAGGA